MNDTEPRRVAVSRLYAALNRPSILVEIGCVSIINNNPTHRSDLEIIESQGGFTFKSGNSLDLQAVISQINQRSALIQRLKMECEICRRDGANYLYVFFN